ncbi:MAG: hypothetical protein QXM16_00665 [Nitrososphaerota archaeon]
MEYAATLKRGKKLNKRFHNTPFRRLQTIVEYKANLEGIGVEYLTRRETKTLLRHAINAGMLPK